MKIDQQMIAHYTHGNLLSTIQDSFARLGKSPGMLAIEDLAAVDEFHLGGSHATKHLIEQIKLNEPAHLLDVGCGLGGAARFVASKFRHQVTGIDLTEEYIETGNVLSGWVKLDRQVTLQQGSARCMPFKNETFDGAYMMHLGMNIKNKTELFAEIHRVLHAGAMFAVYDVMRSNTSEPVYPLP